MTTCRPITSSSTATVCSVEFSTGPTSAACPATRPASSQPCSTSDDGDLARTIAPPVLPPPSVAVRGALIWRAYHADLRRSETAAMRTLFLSRMRELSPSWTREFEQSALRRDMEAAVQNCDSEDAYEVVERWVTALEKGKMPGRDGMGWLHREFWPE